MSENFTFRTPFKNFLLILAYLVFSAGFAQITTSGPTVSAPDPTEDPADVISMYSGVYSDVPIDTWLTPWSPVGTVLEDIQIQGNDTKKYSNVDFLGIETFANPIDASGMDFFHMDVWTPNATIFRVKLVDFGASITEGEIAFAIPQEQWIRLKIPLADFANPTLVTGPTLNSTSSIAQLILSGLPAGGVTVYIDNVYFSKDATTGPPSYTFDGTGGPLTPTGTTSGVVTYTTEVSGISGSTIAGVTCPSTGVEISDVQVPAILGYNTEITNISLFDVQHTFGADLDLRLVSPSGTIYTFNLDNGGSTGLDVATDMCFDISATDCADTWTSSTSAAQPENCLLFETSENNCGPIDASFSFDTGSNSTLINGDLVNGIWTLEITDDAGGDTGSFASFSITFGTIETPPAIDSLGTPIDLVALCDTGDTCMISNTLLESIECDSNDPNNVLVTVSFDVSNGSGEYELVDMANPGVAIGSLTGPMTGTGLIIEGSVPRPTGPGESVDVKVVDTTVSGSSSGTTELAMNGGFETGDLTGWSEFLSGTQTVTVGGFDPTEGSFAANVNNTDIASAAILKNANLGIGTVNPGDPITVSFDARGSGVDGGVTFAEFFSELSGGGTSSNELLGGAPLALNPDPNVWTSFSFNTVAGPDVSGGVTLQFVAATGGAESSLMDLFIDNVSVSIMGAGALCMGDPITVDLPFTEVSFTALDDLSVDAGVQAGQGGGTPTGGVYSGNGVTDDGNGMTYSFDPAAAGVGVHTITYSYTGEGGCTGSASDDVEVTEPEPEPCMISNTSVDLIECDGENAELTVSFDVTNGSGDYELIDVVGDTVIGTLTGPTSGTGLLILGTVPGPIVAGTAINVKVNDAGLGASGPTNLVMNGDFETGDLTNWGGNSEGGTRNVVDDAGNFVAEVIVNSAAEPWRVGLDQVIPLTQGETYRMTYTAYADAPRNITAGIGQAGPDFNSSIVSQPITTTPTVYTHDLVPNYDVVGPGGRVLFDLGDVESTVRIDNVSVVLLGGDAPEMCMGDAIEVIFPDDCQAGPENDLCENATPIACGDTVEGTTADATDSGGFNASPDVFYSLAGTTEGELITVSLCGSLFDTVLTVYDACDGTEVANNDDDFGACGGTQSQLTFTSDGLSTYVIVVEGFGTNTGDYELSVTCEEPQPAPENDLCENATPIACGDDPVTGSTEFATDTGGFNASPDVFYSLTGTAEGEEVTVSLCGSSFDTILTVYDACVDGTQVAINDDFCGLQSQLTFTSDGESTYIVIVEGFGTNSGDYILEVSCETPDPCADDTTGPEITMQAENDMVDCGSEDIEGAFEAWLANNGGAEANDNNGVTWSNNACSENTFTVDGDAEWLTFDNLFFLNGDYCCGSGGPAPDVGPGNQVTIEPNYESGDDVNVETNVFVFADNILAGQSFTFSGNVTSNTLADGYQGTAWIKLFDGGFGLLELISVPLNEGPFTVAYNISQPGAVNIQYGFSTFGLGGAGQDPDSLGNVVIEAVETECVPFNGACGEGTTITFTATDDCGNTSMTTATFSIGEESGCPAENDAYDWTGTIDSDWENTGNWMNGSAPGLWLSNGDVTIPLGMPNYPILMVGQDLYIDECSTVMVDSKASLTVNPNVVVTNDGTVMNDGYAVFESDETGTAYIGAGMGMFLGDFTVERFIPAKRAYRQLSPAVTTTGPISENWQMDTHITGPAGNTDGFDVTLTGNPSMYIFDNDVYNYLEVENTNATNLFPGTMYHILVRGDRNTDLGDNEATPSDTTLKATGELTAENEGSKTIMVDVPEQRFIAVGNPYQSQIDMFNVLEDAVNVAPVFYWVWDPNLGERGAYTAIDVATGTASSGDTDANQNLQSGQAGWVYTAGAGPSSITFDQNKKTNGPETSTFRDGNLVSQGQLRLSLYEDSALANNETATDAVLIMFDSQGNNGIDVYDALNITNLDENFATNNNGTLLSIENRATPVDADVIQLEINTYRNTNYTIVAEGIAMEGPAAYLYDSLTGIYTEIPQSGEVNYSYTVDSENPLTIAGDRFSVVFAGEALSIDDNDIGQIALYPNPTNIGKFYLDVPVGMDDLEVTIYSTLGVRLYHEKGFMGGSTLEIGTEKLFSLGTYFVELSSQGKTITKKLIIN